GFANRSAARRFAARGNMPEVDVEDERNTFTPRRQSNPPREDGKRPAESERESEPPSQANPVTADEKKPDASAEKKAASTDEKAPDSPAEKPPEQQSESGADKAKNAPPSRPFYKRLWVIVIGSIVLVAGLFFLTRYIIHAWHFESTDDAFIDGRVV